MKFSSIGSRIFLTTLAAGIFLSACGAKSSDEQQVRGLIASAEAAAEARDSSDVLALVADDYSDASGFDKAALQNFLRGFFLAHPKLELAVIVESLEFPADGLAQARVKVGMLGTQAGGGAMPLTDVQTLRVELRRQRSEWLVSRADREIR